MLELLFIFIVGHCLADFVLQFETMALYKNRHLEHNFGKNFPPWYYWLTSHAFIHGGVVYLITQNILFGIIETALHWLIDFCKCEKLINLHVDQLLHMLCKVGYIYFLV